MLAEIITIENLETLKQSLDYGMSMKNFNQPRCVNYRLRLQFSCTLRVLWAALTLLA